MYNKRDVLRLYKHAKESNRGCAFVAATIPVGSRLKERLAGFELAPRSVCGEFDGQRTLQHIEIALNWMRHPLGDGTRRYCDHIRGEKRVWSGRIGKGLARNGL